MYFVIFILRIEKCYLLNFKTNAGYYYSTLGLIEKIHKLAIGRNFYYMSEKVHRIEAPQHADLRGVRSVPNRIPTAELYHRSDLWSRARQLYKLDWIKSEKRFYFASPR